jgi:phosphoribosylformylglycinamidine synthase
LALFGALWSEHCSYKSSRHLLGRLPSTGGRVLVGPGENAGVLDIGGGVGLVFKMESHNHPSMVEPFQGAATGVGGILRDVFTMGARPVALLDALRFGPPSNPLTPGLVDGVVRGIGAYGNTVGVPVVGGDVAFDEGYAGNILVNVMALGVVAPERIVRARARAAGEKVVYLGAPTGTDGLRGATMASAAFPSGRGDLRASVQVADPLAGKLLLECCLALNEAGLLSGLQDMGAAGLLSASSELAGRSGLGIDLDLDGVPVREAGLTPEAYLLSETQERALAVCAPEQVSQVLAVAGRRGVAAVVVGEVTPEPLFVVRHRGAVVSSTPLGSLVSGAPSCDRPRAAPPRRLPEPLPVVADFRAALLGLVGSPAFGSRAWIHRQYDGTVRVGTVRGSGQGGAAVVRVAETGRVFAVCVGAEHRFCALDARLGALLSVVARARQLASVGAEPVGVTDCLNFGAPTDPLVAAQLADAVDGIAQGCGLLGVPVVSGNVSLFNATDGRSIPPTPMLGMVGVVEEPARVGGHAFRPGEVLLRVGPFRDELDGSLWLAHHGLAGAAAPSLDPAMELAVHACTREAVRAGLATTARAVTSGGLLRALVEGVLAQGVGAQVDEAAAAPGPLLSEAPSRVLVSCPEVAVEAWRALGHRHGCPVEVIGRTGGAVVGLGPLSLGLDELEDAWEGAMASLWRRAA